VKLTQPVKTLLRDPLDEAMANRVLRGVRQRRGELARPRAAGRIGMLGIAVLLACVSLSVWLIHRGRPSLGDELALSDGTKLGDVEAAGAPSTVRLGDGSELLLAAGARLAPVINTGSLLVLRVIVGTVTFDVRPGGPRRWSIEGGLATIEVTGTRFTVSRRASSLRVDVERGAVLVRGENVPDRLQRLSAGEELVFDEPRVGSSESPLAETPEATGSGDRTAAPSSATGTPTVPKSTSREPTREPTRRSTPSVTSLLEKADRARATGHPELAIKPLREIAEQFGSDARAAGAAFTLGKIQTDLQDWPSAERAFALAISLGLPSGLLEDAYARLVEAHARGGDRLGAQRVMDAYLSRYPNGSRARAMRHWLDAP
jgi:transmembrane sensor